MKPEEKELLLKDLCARLRYGVKLDFYSKATGQHYVSTLLGIEPDGDKPIIAKVNDGAYTLGQDHIKPYLRPMSSMTEKEFENLKEYSGLKYEQLDLASYQNGTHKCLDFYLSEIPSDVVILVFDWLNENMFDYRGLIPMGLALEAKEQSLVERLDEIKANSVTDEDFKRVWGKPIDECVEEDMKKWDKLCKSNKKDT